MSRVMNKLRLGFEVKGESILIFGIVLLIFGRVVMIVFFCVEVSLVF